MRPGDDGHTALVVSVGRNAVWIAFDDEQTIRLGALRRQSEPVALVPGDRVIAQPLDDGHAIVDRREPRDSELVRKTPGGRRKTMAANVDTLAIVASFARPPPDLPMVDELLAFGEDQHLRAVIVLTKPDLAPADDLAGIPAIYRPLGYETLVVNPKTGEGVAVLTASLAGHRTLLIGHSGAGKSSLFRALGGESVIGDVSKSGSGRQTTMSSRLLRLDDGFLIDSPGIGQFALHEVTPAELAWAFKEIRPYAGTCRFADCTHRVEPDCAVVAAGRAGTISPSRFASYRTIATRELG